MGGNRKHGFMRGNANGRRRAHYEITFFCEGCQREHGAKVERVGYKEKLYCNRQYFKLRDKEAV